VTMDLDVYIYILPEGRRGRPLKYQGADYHVKWSFTYLRTREAILENLPFIARRIARECPDENTFIRLRPVAKKFKGKPLIEFHYHDDHLLALPPYRWVLDRVVQDEKSRMRIKRSERLIGSMPIYSAR